VVALPATRRVVTTSPGRGGTLVFLSSGSHVGNRGEPAPVPTKVLSVYVNVNTVFFTHPSCPIRQRRWRPDLSFQIGSGANKPFRSFEIGLISDGN